MLQANQKPAHANCRHICTTFMHVSEKHRILILIKEGESTTSFRDKCRTGLGLCRPRPSSRPFKTTLLYSIGSTSFFHITCRQKCDTLIDPLLVLEKEFLLYSCNLLSTYFPCLVWRVGHHN